MKLYKAAKLIFSLIIFRNKRLIVKDVVVFFCCCFEGTAASRAPLGASILKFTQQAGGRLRGGGQREEAEGSILQPPLFGPRAALSARPLLFVPPAERAAPMGPLERNEKKRRIAAVTWALFHSARSPWQRGRDPGSTRPLSLWTASRSLSPRSLTTVSCREISPIICFKCTKRVLHGCFCVFFLRVMILPLKVPHYIS